MKILGISCFYHDAAACLVVDGRIVAAAQEERFNRKKNYPDFPLRAANYCLQAGNITINDVDHVCFYEQPFLKFLRVVLSHLRAFPGSYPNFSRTMPSWLQDRLIMPLVFKRELGFEGKTLFIKHHLSHAASVFLPSPFEEAAILTADSVGERATMTQGRGSGNKIGISKEMRFPDSLGLVYTAVTTHLGFEALEGEGKVMGLAAYGKPKYLELFRHMIPVNRDGSFTVDRRYFGFNSGTRMFTKLFTETFGKERLPEGKIEERHCDIAASLQAFTEETLLVIARALHEETKSDNLCLAGGLFLNCVANQRILEETPFKNIFIQPAAGDAGGAIGAALYADHCLLDNPRRYPMTDAYLGPEYSETTIRKKLQNAGVAFEEYDEGALAALVASKIAEGKVIGWLQGRMEIGPRALGNRSILADPRKPEMKDILNLKVKHREPFRPFAPVALEERAAEFFDIKEPSPFMLLAPRVREDKRTAIPAVTHVDGTARLQTVNEKTNPKLYRLIKEFGRLTGIPVIINTSFNLRGEPVVCSPGDALDCFNRSAMDCLVMGNFVVKK